LEYNHLHAGTRHRVPHEKPALENPTAAPPLAARAPHDRHPTSSSAHTHAPAGRARRSPPGSWPGRWPPQTVSPGCGTPRGGRWTPGASCTVGGWMGGWMGGWVGGGERGWLWEGGRGKGSAEMKGGCN